MYTVIRHNGRLYKVVHAPFETSDRAADRAWWMAKNGGNASESHKWCYEKYFGIKYDHTLPS
jgi:hypothetical protein